MHLVGILIDPDRWTPDGITAAATASIAFLTFVLVFVTNRQATLTKESIKIANSALTELEAPFILVQITDAGLTKRKLNEGYDFGTLWFTLANHGRTPAKLVEIVHKSELVQITGSGIPKPMDLEFRCMNTLPYGVIAAPRGESQPFSRDLLADHKTIVEGDPRILRKNDLFFYGFVRYATIFKETYRMGFCFSFDRKGDRWILVGEGNYNYLTKES